MMILNLFFFSQVFISFCLKLFYLFADAQQWSVIAHFSDAVSAKDVTMYHNEPFSLNEVGTSILHCLAEDCRVEEKWLKMGEIDDLDVVAMKNVVCLLAVRFEISIGDEERERKTRHAESYSSFFNG
jgi:hypothetical protein